MLFREAEPNNPTIPRTQTTPKSAQHTASSAHEPLPILPRALRWVGASAGGAGGDAVAKLAEDIVAAIGALHLPQEGGKFGEDGEGCDLCCGVGGDGGCGADDALAMSTGLKVVGEGRKEFFGGETLLRGKWGAGGVGAAYPIVSSRLKIVLSGRVGSVWRGTAASPVRGDPLSLLSSSPKKICE